MRNTLVGAYSLLCILCFTLLPSITQAQSPNAWVNELHYDNEGGDEGEFVEVVVQNAGSYTLSNFEVLHYNGADGDPDAASPVTLGEFSEGTTSEGFTLFSYNYTANGETLQNGAPDGIALCHNGTLVQFLSYEGSFEASGGCADGVISADIGVEETSDTPIGYSLQLTGSSAAYPGFSWSGPSPDSPGDLNSGQALLSSPIVVDQGGGGDFASIQEGVDAAGNGYVLDVQSGTYTENVTVDKELTLEGPNAGIPGDDGGRSAEATIEGQVVISASDAVFDGFDVAPPEFGDNTGEGEAVRVSNAPDGVTVTNNVVRDFTDGGEATSFFDATAINAFGGNANDPVSTVTIRDNKVERVARDLAGAGAVGISIQGNVDGADVEGNVIQDIGQERSAYALAIAVRSTGNHNVDPKGVSITDNQISDVLPDPQSDFDGVGFEFEPEHAANPVTVENNSFSNTTLQVEDKTLNLGSGLDLDEIIANNTFDRAVTIRNANGGVKAEGNVQKIYSPISPAVETAAPGETVQVNDGTYDESVTVDKPLTLQDASTPTVNAFDVAADNVTISGFEITGGTTSAGSGITVGVFVQSGTSGHAITGNNLNGPGGDGTGVLIDPSASSTEIAENNISGWNSGIEADDPGTEVFVAQNCIAGNTTAGLKSTGGEPIAATGNYWGASDGPSGDFVGSGDAVLGNVTVDFSPKKVEACPAGDPTPTECNAATLSESVQPPEDGNPGVVTATFSNPDDIEKIEFTKLENFTVTDSPDNFTENGDTWTWDGTGDPTEVVFELTQETIGETSVYFAIASSTCAAEDDGLLEVNFDPIHELSPDAPAAMIFSGNYPNPFSGQTTVEFALPERTDVTLAVYDMMGRKVATLVDGPERAGTHRISWGGRTDEGRALASGVYLLRLEVGKKVSTERATIVR